MRAADRIPIADVPPDKRLAENVAIAASQERLTWIKVYPESPRYRVMLTDLHLYLGDDLGTVQLRADELEGKIRRWLKAHPEYVKGL